MRVHPAYSGNPLPRLSTLGLIQNRHAVGRAHESIGVTGCAPFGTLPAGLQPRRLGRPANKMSNPGNKLRRSYAMDPVSLNTNRAIGKRSIKFLHSENRLFGAEAPAEATPAHT